MARNNRRPGWALCLQFSLLVLGSISLAILVLFQDHKLPVDAAEPVNTWKESFDLPFQIDSDMWALQHRNHTQLHRRATDVNQDQDYTCDKENPCSNGACCGESGVCGYGKTYCGLGCTSNCDAKAACGRDSESGHAKCPLYVERTFGCCLAIVKLMISQKCLLFTIWILRYYKCEFNPNQVQYQTRHY